MSQAAYFSWKLSGSEWVGTEPGLNLTVILHFMCKPNRDRHSFKTKHWICVTQFMPVTLVVCVVFRAPCKRPWKDFALYRLNNTGGTYTVMCAQALSASTPMNRKKSRILFIIWLHFHEKLATVNPNVIWLYFFVTNTTWSGTCRYSWTRTRRFSYWIFDAFSCSRCFIHIQHLSFLSFWLWGKTPAKLSLKHNISTY